MSGTLLIFGFDIIPIAETLMDVFLALYTIIALVVIRQIKFMARTIESKYNKYLLWIAYLHLFTVIALLIFSITSL